MNYGYTTCSVFEMSEGEPPRKQKKFYDIDPSNRSFLTILSRSAQEDGLELHYKVQPLPYIRTTDFTQVTDSRFDADYAICMYPNLQTVGPEVGHIILDRSKKYRHVFLVTRTRSPEHDVDLIKGLNAVTLHSLPIHGHIHEPQPIKTIDKEEIIDAEQGDVISYWSVKSIRNLDTRREILSVFAKT